MKPALDIAEMDAALKRAAVKAVQGTREERSGRFRPANQRPASSADGRGKQREQERREA